MLVKITNADVKKIPKEVRMLKLVGGITGCTNNMQFVKSCAGCDPPLKGHLP